MTSMNDAATYLPVFKSSAGHAEFLNAYDRLMKFWPTDHETMEVETEFGSCHVIVSGPKEGKPVFMFHGMTGNSAMWYPTIEALSGFRTYCIDAPGDFGKSKARKRIRTSHDAVLWMDQIFDSLGYEKAAFIGHSMGGWFCSNYALARPERIERLTLLAPVATFLPIPLLKLLRYIYPAMLIPNRHRIERAWNWFCSKGYTLPPHVMDVVVAAYSHGRSQLPVIPRVIEPSAWKKLSAPVLFLVGEEEKIYDAGEVMKVVVGTLPSSTVGLIQGAGHCLILEKKGAVNKAIHDFMVS
ncbi:alpha/beta hydrolase [Paenibacillus alginolyticus]|uniref:Alpha/beta hydrolase n=1 Tax=Paenibacillus alginolyticus TaxID=59839 RepID=A0ABT4G579_9BACL|nr:alpha/beta hydrolase [Paenibacillus alginolyticus]MCY9669273.1 alpha/beta hydrolase [Paenibacillus alginolyticus]MCY9691324.1 alpha/beta hydrolase [Paenibacillus alginolyticus]MEC0147998.1 alpha/beta hydrolase [Paenibacillus alginolyticus]